MSKMKRTYINPLLNCSEAIFAYLAALKDDVKARRMDMDFRETLINEFLLMEKKAIDMQIPMIEFRDAKYALTAFIDELVLSSAWPGRDQWMARPLQLDFFGEHTAGEGFFTRLATLRQGGEDNVDLLELYYYCMQLGFEGTYKIKGLEHLMALQVDLRAQIDSYRGPVESVLAPPGLPGYALINKVRRQVPYWVIVVVTIAAVFFSYIGYSVTANNLAEANFTALQTEQSLILKSIPPKY